MRSPAHCTPCNASVGADAPVRPPNNPRTPCKNHVIARPVRKLAVAIRIPRPLGPLPKGDWHGEAVAGGFFSRTSCNPSVGATLAVARPLHLLLRFRRGRRLPTVVPTDFRSLSCPPIGALPRNRLASSATGSASPISPTARPEFFPHPRQGTRALPYKVLRYRALADRVARSLK